MTTKGSFYLYDLDALAVWAARVRAAIPQEMEVYYACKANPLSHILAVLDHCGFGFDLASAGELRQVNRAAPGSSRLCTGPAKTEKFLTSALDSGVRRFVVESRAQLELLEECARAKNLRAQVLLRLQLRWNEGSSVLGGSALSAFGLEAQEWQEVLRESTFTNLEMEGVHVFQWGNELSLERLQAIWERVAKTALAFANDCRFPLRVLDLGGGIGLPYDNYLRGAEILAPESLGPVLHSIQALVPESKILLELGRYLVGPCGTYSTVIVDRKRVRDDNFLLTEGGAHHLVRPALVGQNFPARLQRASTAAAQEFRVHGPLCTALDKLGTFSLPGDVRAGDRLEFLLAGAYGFTESMPYFLCHDGAAEIVRKNGELQVAREAMAPEDWLR